MKRKPLAGTKGAGEYRAGASSRAIGRAVRIALPLLALACAAFSCARSAEDTLRLPANPLLSGGPGWAVIKESYARLKDAPSASGKDLSFLRRGGVYRIDGREIGTPARAGDRGIWFRIEAEGILGWARERDLDVHPSRERAEKAAAALR